MARHPSTRIPVTVLSKRINVILPDAVAVLDRVVPKGKRIKFLDRAIETVILALIGQTRSSSRACPGQLT